MAVVAPEAFEERVRSSFARQTVMETIGARLVRVAPGEVDIELPVAPAVAQQHGFVHAGIVSTIADSACGYAALSLMDRDTAVLTAEFKINLLAPAAGDRLVARGKVVRAGRTLSVATAEVEAISAAGSKVCAIMTATIMCVRDRGALSD
ncbi:MAG: PaaI family thioesterase [Rubrivivax sp.]|nr:PaaI family thioesterase [Rubrivivax sp.]